AYRVLSGEASRFELSIPDGVEVTQVSGDAVLQWTAERRGNERVVSVLLKYLVDDATSIDVATQHPRGSGGGADLKLVRASDATLREGFIALEGRAGFELAVTKSEDASAMATGDLPSELLSATDKPLLAAFRFEKEPKVAVTVTRNEQVELTQAVIDDLEAVTIVGEEGVEIVKLKLFVRNNTRQYLGVTLPADSHVTHALIDGAPIQPAVTAKDTGEVLLVPLRQSEKIGARGRRVHYVQSGDTLGGIALRYYNRADRARDIATANGNLRADQLQVGQALVVPSGGSSVQESSFVVELAYETRRAALGTFGRRVLTLPALDIAVMTVHWNAYLPNAYEPLRFATELRQLDALRYDPLTRLRYYIASALATRDAWAGGGSAYENILRSRKMIFDKEQKKQAKVVLTSFPLVGERYRFSRVLLGTERAKLDVSYVRRSAQPWVRGAVFVCVLLALWVWLTRSRETRRFAWRNRDFAVLAVMLGISTILGHYVLGIHRSVLLALDVGLLLFLVHDIWRRWKPSSPTAHQTMILRRGFRGRWLLRFAVLVAGAYLLVMFPMFWSLIALVALAWLVARRLEVRHG
ncbi:MAG TPA: LysM peptidoglycan-binding domain-containing protein, partial [Myxococcota bacterium]|nr:LysM peptidoglycan-binding domain-containing protein [Myxococcota bacterium]